MRKACAASAQLLRTASMKIAHGVVYSMTVESRPQPEGMGNLYFTLFAFAANTYIPNACL
jgi:hypothetical protein